MEAASVKFPELFFGLAGPIGVDMQDLVRILTDELRKVRYKAEHIHVTQLKGMMDHAENIEGGKNDYFTEMMTKIDSGNNLCRTDRARIARMIIKEIRSRRANINAQSRSDGRAAKDEIPASTAYIIRQLKRPQEVNLLRQVYGKQFILISAYGSEQARRARIIEKIRNSISTSTKESQVAASADRLIERDAGEEDDAGQQLRETFHMADVFVDGISKPEMKAKLERFVQALFGRTDITPSKFEYGMYAAKSASLRSADLSRQVGAAIFSPDGELIVQGCNEAPKAHGGTYWDLETQDNRDIKKGYDPNHHNRNQLLRDLFERLGEAGLLSEKAKAMGSPAEIVDRVTKKETTEGKVEKGALVGSRIMDITEFGRIVHAEMCAICDAARLGRSIKGATLFCTTFPCHNCAKHIIASGIRRVIYMEPYPKSKAKMLHSDEISIEEDNPEKVSFLPFLGISPYRYRDIFQKDRRKDEDGKALDWYQNSMQPMVDAKFPKYIEAEQVAIGEEFARLTPRDAEAKPDKQRPE